MYILYTNLLHTRTSSELTHTVQYVGNVYESIKLIAAPSTEFTYFLSNRMNDVCDSVVFIVCVSECVCMFLAISSFLPTVQHMMGGGWERRGFFNWISQGLGRGIGGGS